MKILKVLLVPSFSKENSIEIINNVCNVLTKSGFDVCTDVSNKNFMQGVIISFCDIDSAKADYDFIVAVGGDGTIIHASKYALEADIPIVGVNAGRLGFLASVETDDLNILENLSNGCYTIQERMTINVTIHTNQGNITYSALNDAVITRGLYPRIIDLTLLCNDKTVSKFRADGLIFSTPTGSTAYNLSAGGPITDPDIDAINVTPICPHTISPKSFVFNSDKILTVVPDTCTDNSILLSVDGEDKHLFKKNDYITISKSDLKVKFVRFNTNQFFEIINEKMLGKII